LRPNEPKPTSTLPPGLLRPFFVVTATAPPSVFRPNVGFDPGMICIVWIAACGIRSQLTTSPNGSLMRTPSMNTDKPCGVPSSGDAVKPR